MIRHCDGTDDLVGLDTPPGHPLGIVPIRTYCGQTFDDAECSTICPHKKLGPKLTEAELNELFEAVNEDRPIIPERFRPEVLETFELKDKGT